MAAIDLDELSKHDGKDGNTAYVAANGKVYDVSASRLWKDGAHMGQHHAGADLTQSLGRAPHGPEVLERFKDVGELAASAASQEGDAAADATAPPPPRASETPWWARLMLAMKSHPITIHFPQALFVFAPVFLTLYYVTDGTAFSQPAFERTALFLLVAALLTAIPATATGVVHWWFKYGGKSRPVFKLKMLLSPLLVILAAGTVGVHIGKGELPADAPSVGLLILYWLHFPIVTVLGKAGGNIVFGK
ncbi:MAG: hypothetical protein LBT74_07485 [Acidobacteriota bacterium]|jgi:predicted heme/steroid binding protein/uncharacterized membrane protein|nr:hypothetical protein [Acidobacteriota bacterium]